jgi:primary-amine oxidase
MIDGLENTVIESNICPVDEPTGSAAKFAGNGFYVQETTKLANSTTSPMAHR